MASVGVAVSLHYGEPCAESHRCVNEMDLSTCHPSTRRAVARREPRRTGRKPGLPPAGAGAGKGGQVDKSEILESFLQLLQLSMLN